MKSKQRPIRDSALITGLWKDVDKVKGPMLRGLAARAPYFHNGSAASLNDVLDFYEKRFNIGFAQERGDLIAFRNAFVASITDAIPCSGAEMIWTATRTCIRKTLLGEITLTPPRTR